MNKQRSLKFTVGQAVLILALMLFVLGRSMPSAQAAVATSYSYVVTVSDDAHDDNPSDTSCFNGVVGGCTLRAAIEQSFNHSPATITFDSSLNGQTFTLNNSYGTLLWPGSQITVTGNITVSGASLNAGASIFQISGSDNRLLGLTIKNAPEDGIQVGDFSSVGEGNRNLIQSVVLIGNGASGIYVYGGGASGGHDNVIQNNFIGTRSATPIACVGAEANLQYGIYIAAAAVGTQLNYNRIVCNGRDGVSIDGTGGAPYNTYLYLNLIGTNGSTSMGNGWAGIAIYAGAHDLTSDTDVVSSNGTQGIYIGGSATRNIMVTGDVIGGSALPNAADGIFVNSVSNAQAVIYDSLIIGNGQNGVRIGASAGVTITQNWIGTNYLVTMPLGNALDGVRIENGSYSNNVLSNTIAYNINGVRLTGGGTSGNHVQANTIEYQSSMGVQIDGDASSNRIGSPLGGPLSLGNTIVRNTQNGIYISGASTQLNFVFSNLIGVQTALAHGPASGCVDANLNIGLVLDNGAKFNVIGSTAADANTIECNGFDGMQIVNGAHHNTVAGNTINSNGLNGISLFGAAYANTVGGSTLAGGNAIRNNTGHGVYIADSGTTTNTIQTNQISSNLADGIAIQNGARANRIGGTNYIVENVIAGNQANGIDVSDSPNTFIGTNSVNGNHGYGVLLDGAATINTLITGTISVYNAYAGIGERSGAGLNVWSHVFMHDNVGLGIDKFADFGNTANIVNAPTAVITSVIRAGSTTTIKGTGLNGSLVEVYEVAPDPSGFGEGKNYVGTAVISSGKWTLTASSFSIGCYTLFETAGFIIYASSEFSANSCRTFLPVVLK
jgi:parallel beta-helix repeat protein